MVAIALRWGFPLLVISVNSKRLPSFSRIPSAAALPALPLEQRERARRVVGQRRDRAVVPLGVDREGSAHALALAVEHEADDLIDVDRHAEGAAHARGRRTARGARCSRCSCSRTGWPRRRGTAGPRGSAPPGAAAPRRGRGRRCGTRAPGSGGRGRCAASSRGTAPDPPSSRRSASSWIRSSLFHSTKRKGPEPIGWRLNSASRRPKRSRASPAMPAPVHLPLERSAVQQVLGQDAVARPTRRPPARRAACRPPAPCAGRRPRRPSPARSRRPAARGSGAP